MAARRDILLSECTPWHDFVSACFPISHMRAEANMGLCTREPCCLVLGAHDILLQHATCSHFTFSKGASDATDRHKRKLPVLFNDVIDSSYSHSGVHGRSFFTACQRCDRCRI